jgi:hypothetical protein
MMKAIDYFGTEKMHFTGFCNFCKHNIPLLFSVTFALFFTCRNSVIIQKGVYYDTSYGY